MSENTSLHSDITRLFLENLHLDVPSVETDLLETGVLDSLTFVDLLMHLEQRFGTKISMDDLEISNFRSIAKIAEFVRHNNGFGG